MNSDTSKNSEITAITVQVSGHMKKSDFQTKVDTEFDDRGIYLVYSYVEDKNEYHLQYIGKSIDLPERVTEKHEHYNDWLRAADGKEENLSVSIISLPKYIRILHCEAALIFALQPPINTQNKKTYDWDELKVIFSGRKVCGRDYVVANRTVTLKR